MSDAWLIAFGLVLVLEGLIPALAPRLWKKMVRDISTKSDNQLRAVGVALMLMGLAWVFFVK